MSYEAYYMGRIIAHCEWYFGRPVQLIMFRKGCNTHCVVVPAHSTLRSSAQCAASQILISSSDVERPLLTLHNKVLDLIGSVYTVGEGGALCIDEAEVPLECWLRDRGPSEGQPTMPNLASRSGSAGEVGHPSSNDADIANGAPQTPAASSSLPVFPRTEVETPWTLHNLLARTHPAHQM